MLKNIRRLARLSVRKLTIYLAKTAKLLPFKQSLRIRAYLSQKPRRHPAITGLKVCNHEFQGYIDKISSNVISGWIYSDAEAPVTLTLELNRSSTFDTTANIFRQDLLDNGLPSGQAGFKFVLPKATDAKAFDFRILSKNCGSTVFSGRFIADQTTEQINSLLNVQKALKNGSITGLEGPASEWLLEQVIPALVQNIRSSSSTSSKVRIPPLNSRPFIDETPILVTTVDIIIPVYSGLKETQDCIKSVLNAIYEMPYEIIVINDAGPDSILNEWLRDLGDQQKITLYENSVNLGFVGTVNKGMKLHPWRDIILLNSDTIVSNNWLDRLKNAAYSNKNIATATPFSNNASILSFPKQCFENSLPSGFSAQEVDEHFKEQNAGIIADLPTAHGFCMFIRRAVLNQIGYFDEELWGRGYAEENDFSLRATTAGWRNVLVADTFVQHVGSVSFSESADARIRKNLEKLNLLYPDYEVNVHHFIESDPLFSLRNKVALSLLKDSCNRLNTKIYLYISHSLGGGTEVHINYMSELLQEENIDVLLLKPDSHGRYCLESTRKSIFVTWDSSQFDAMVKDLKSLHINHIHYHHWIGFDNRIFNLPKLLGKQFDVTLHDYYTICPRVNMVTESNRFCDSASFSDCNTCLAKNPPHSENKIALDCQSTRIQSWRKSKKNFLKSARQVFAPSHDTAKRINYFLNLDNLRALYHPESEVNTKIGDLKRTEYLRVAVPGGISRNKGFDRLVSCVTYALEKDLPIQFIVIGYSCDDKKLNKFPNVKITGRYQHNQFTSIARKYNCNVSVLFSLWPETYGFTLTESVNAGMPVLSFNIGAYAERINKLEVGRVLPLDASDQQICEALIELTENFEPSEISMGNVYPSLVSDYYQLGATSEHKKTA